MVWGGPLLDAGSPLRLLPRLRVLPRPLLLDDSRSRHTDVRHSGEAVPRHRLYRGKADAPPSAADEEGPHLGGGASSSKPPLLLGEAVGGNGDEVVHISGRLSICTEDDSTSSSLRSSTSPKGLLK